MYVTADDLSKTLEVAKRCMSREKAEHILRDMLNKPIFISKFEKELAYTFYYYIVMQKKEPTADDLMATIKMFSAEDVYKNIGVKELIEQYEHFIVHYLWFGEVYWDKLENENDFVVKERINSLYNNARIQVASNKKILNY